MTSLILKEIVKMRTYFKLGGVYSLKYSSTVMSWRSVSKSYIARIVSNNTAHFTIMKYSHSFIFKSGTFRQILRPSLFAVPFGIAVGRHGNYIAKCRIKSTQSSRLSPIRSSQESYDTVNFNWSLLWEIIAPDIIILILAAAVSYNYMLYSVIIY